MRSFQPFAMRFVVTAQVNPSALTCSRMLSGPTRSPRRATCDDTEVEAAQANCSVVRVHALPGPRRLRWRLGRLASDSAIYPTSLNLRASGSSGSRSEFTR